MKVSSFTAVLGLIGCMESEGVAADLDGSKANCPADEYQSLIGANLAAVTLPADLDIRVLRYGQMKTMDHIPSRLNLQLDADGRIANVYCG